MKGIQVFFSAIYLKKFIFDEDKLVVLNNIDRIFFQENGFIIRKKFIPKPLIENVINTFIKFCKKLGGEKFNVHDSVNDFYSEEFNKKLIELREEKPKVYGAIYDTMQTTVSMQKIALHKNILQDVSKLLSTQVTNLMCFNYLFRMDPPHCNRNKLDWHQDFITYDQVDMSDGLTAWIPLIDIPLKLGPLRALKKSHLYGRVEDYEINENSSINNLVSHKHKIKNSVIDKYTSVSLPVNSGDIIYISMNLIHASGDNISNRIRFSGQGRFYNILSDSFPPGRPQFTKSQLN